MPPISKYGLCPHCLRRFEATGQTFPEIEAKVQRQVDDHMLKDHREMFE